MFVSKHRIELVDEVLPAVDDRRWLGEFRHPPGASGVSKERRGEQYASSVRLVTVGLCEKMLNALRNEHR